jgi:hypothetical protein
MRRAMTNIAFLAADPFSRMIHLPIMSLRRPSWDNDELDHVRPSSQDVTFLVPINK